MVVVFSAFSTSKMTAVYRLYFFHIDLIAQKGVSALKKGSKFDGCCFFSIFYIEKDSGVSTLVFSHRVNCSKRGLRVENGVKIRWLLLNYECFIDGQNHTVPFSLGFWGIVTDESVRFTLIILLVLNVLSGF